MCVRACGVCVAQARTTWCPCSPHSPHAGSLPSTEECCWEGNVAGYTEERVNGVGGGVRPHLLFKMLLFLCILDFKAWALWICSKTQVNLH